MKLPRIRPGGLFLAVGLLLSGCSTAFRSVQMYEGPPLPRARFARVYLSGLMATYVDGKRMFCVLPLDLSPGPHVISFSLNYTRTLPTITMSLTLEPGKDYQADPEFWQDHPELQVGYWQVHFHELPARRAD